MSKVCVSFIVFGYAFLYVPIIFLIVYSFNESSSADVWTGFSLKWFRSVFDNQDLLQSALSSIEVAFLAATGSVILGTLTAVATSRTTNFLGRKFLNGVIAVPMVIPDVVLGFALLILFIALENTFGIPKGRGMATVTIGHVMASIAYVHITIKTRLVSFDQSLEEAAMNLGAKPLGVFTSITIPVIGSSVFAGWLLAFTLSLDDIVIASFLSGPGATTLPILIFSNIKIGITPELNAFATLFMLVVASCLVGMTFITREPKLKKKKKQKRTLIGFFVRPS
jgi:putrescine transport system permease protein